MITIIHGDDLASSRSFFYEQKKKAQSPIFLEGEKATLTDIIQILEGGSLFGNAKTVFIENLISSKKSSKELESIMKLINTHHACEIYLWEGKKLTVKDISFFKEADVRLFKLPSVLFTFLENIKPSNASYQIGLFHKTLSTLNAELIFSMIVRQFRLLLSVSPDGKDEIEEVKKLASWQKGKLKRQARSFPQEKLLTSYQKLFTIDLEQKTGGSSLSLDRAIDFFLLSL